MAENEQLKVLIVDDDISLGMLLSNTLRNEGFQPFTANNGKAGIAKAKEIQPDVIFMDINMPQMNGFDACEAIKQDDAIDSIPIIFMTSMGNDNDRIKGFDSGAEDYIVKPVNYKEILARLKRFIHVKNSQSIMDSIRTSVDSCKNLLAQLQERDQLAGDSVLLELDSTIDQIVNDLDKYND